LRIYIGVLLLLTSPAYSATLRQESIQAWDRYVAAADGKMKARTQENATFLWVDESPVRLHRVQSGEMVVSETVSGGSKKAPSALIHDWIGAAFIPGAKIDDVVSVLRNYNAYREYYRPNVVSSRTLAQDSLNDRFAVLLVNQSLALKTAVEAECQASYTQVNDTRWYGTTYSTRIQEIEDLGRSAERRLAAGEGVGYLWRLASITRFEERDGGVYFEVEAMALSRDVPLSLRFVVDPIVRRVSKNSLAESLRQTGKAVNESLAMNNGAVKVANERKRAAPQARRSSAFGTAMANP